MSSFELRCAVELTDAVSVRDAVLRQASPMIVPAVLPAKTIMMSTMPPQSVASGSIRSPQKNKSCGGERWQKGVGYVQIRTGTRPPTDPVRTSPCVSHCRDILVFTGTCLVTSALAGERLCTKQ